MGNAMDATSKLIARNMFKLRVHEAKGTAFQKLFEKVMVYRSSGFTPIKPHGNIGDRKNDGYIRSEGRYFQVYAPEDPESSHSVATAASKAANDFEGLKAFWESLAPIRDFRFVFNDEYRGSPPPLEAALAKIRDEHGIEASAFLAKDLEADALSLPQDQLVDIIGVPIPEVGLLDSVDFGILREVICHVLEQRLPIKADGVLNAPDFNEKIKINGLSQAVASLLTVGSYQSEAVEDYFSKNSNFARQEVRDRLSAMYQLSRHRYTGGVESANTADLVFFDLLNTVTPSSRNAPAQQQAAVQDAAIVVMAYYFEACDIFEVPYATT